MTAAHVNKLATLARCPVCGGDRDDRLSYSATDFYTRADYVCGAAFVATHEDSIFVATPCPAGSQVQAELLNHEVEEAGHG